MSLLEGLGIYYNNVHYLIKIRCIVADAPARSFIKNCKAHNAYFGCERCVTKGRYNKNYKKVIFPTQKKNERRSDESFRSMSQIQHHNGKSPLSALNVGLVSEVVLDYMHLICLGVMRKLLRIWVHGPLPHKLARSQILAMSEFLISCRENFPSEFSRKPRPLKDLDHWKATEFRTFLLYTGPTCVASVLPTKKLKHFLLLHTAVYVLSLGPKITDDWIDYAEDLIRIFIKEMPILYSNEVMTYNFHSITHICDDVRKFGSLDQISAFPFENYMRLLKNMVRSNSNQLGQVANRIYEFEVNLGKPEAKTKDSEFHSYGKNCWVVHKNTRISNCSGDNCFLLSNGKVCKIIDIFKTESRIEIHCKYFRDPEELTNYPCNTSLLSIYKLRKVSKQVHSITINELERKCVLLTKSDKYICIPFCQVL